MVNKVRLTLSKSSLEVAIESNMLNDPHARKLFLYWHRVQILRKYLISEHKIHHYHSTS